MNKEEAIEILSEMRSEYNLLGDEEEATRYHVLSWAIKEMNGESVEHGKWIKNEGRYGWHCSECKKDNYYAYVLNSENEKYELQDNYCPNCGSKMDVPDTDVGKMEDKDEEIF